MVRRLAGAKLDRMIEVLKKHGLVAMTLLRLVPLALLAVSIGGRDPHEALGIVVVGTAIGLLPGNLTTTVLRRRDRNRDHRQRPGELVAGRRALALLAGGAWAVKRWFTRMGRRIAEHGEAGHQPR